MSTSSTCTGFKLSSSLASLAVAVACALALLLALAPSALGKQTYILDEYGLYPSSTAQQLESQASQLAGSYGVAPYLVVVDDIGASSVRSYAESYWLEHELGLGSDTSGIMFLIAVDSRDYVTITHGKGIYTFTDYGIEQLEDAVVEHLSDNEWGEAATTYLDECSRIMAFAAEKGEPLDSNNDPSNIAFGLLISAGLALLLALAVALIVRRVLKGQLTSVATGSSAAGFMTGAVALTAQNDAFVGSHVSVVPKPKDNGGSGGGGSTISASGFGGSSGGKF
ncbi:MAG: TPM domain-containing protein [Coriobacteriales bacterium]